MTPQFVLRCPPTLFSFPSLLRFLHLPIHIIVMGRRSGYRKRRIWWWKTILSFFQGKQLSSSPGGSTTCPQEIQWPEKACIQRSVYAHAGAVMLDQLVPCSLPGKRRIIFFLKVEPGKNGEKATPCWITADEKPSNLQRASAFSVGHGNQIYCKHF